MGEFFFILFMLAVGIGIVAFITCAFFGARTLFNTFKHASPPPPPSSSTQRRKGEYFPPDPPS